MAISKTQVLYGKLLICQGEELYQQKSENIYLSLVLNFFLKCNSF